MDPIINHPTYDWDPTPELNHRGGQENGLDPPTSTLFMHVPI